MNDSGHHWYCYAHDNIRVKIQGNHSSNQIAFIYNEGEGNAVNYKPSEHCTDKQIYMQDIAFTLDIKTK